VAEARAADSKLTSGARVLKTSKNGGCVVDVLVERAAGIDVHKKSVTVCVMTSEGRTRVSKTLCRFSTFHRDLVAMRDWLTQMAVTQVAMEATGEYWKPVYEVLEGSVAVIVANAQHVKNVPGRKTDPEDAAWLARLVRHGLVRGSFVPSRPIRDLRDHTRMRRKTIEMRSRVENRVQKVLEGCGIKLGSVVSDVFGATGRAILEKLAAGETTPATLAELAKGTLKNKKGELELSLEGTFTSHDAALLQHQLTLHRQLDDRRAAIECELGVLVKPYAAGLALLDTIPGINRDAATEILGEIGDDLTPWTTSRHFAAWAGLCPGNHESAGKRRKIATRHGNPFLKSILVQCATTAVRTKGSYYQAKFLRLAKRRGYKRAIVAVAHAMLVAIYHIIRRQQPFHDLGAEWFVTRSPESKVKTLLRQLEKLGYSAEIRPAAV
jgi:transposase